MSSSGAEDASGSLSKDQVLSMYMTSARNMRKRTVQTLGRPARKKGRVPSPTDPESGQLSISVGKMKYDKKKCKGVPMKGLAIQKMYINRDTAYDNVLDKIKDELYDQKEQEGDFEYYISDTSGVPIAKDGKLVIQKRDGTSKSYDWTLANWLNVSGIRYQSRARLYCVQKRIESDVTSGDDEKDSEPTASSSTCLNVTNCYEKAITSSTPRSSGQKSIEINGDFEPLFASITKSRYTETHVVVEDLTKESAKEYYERAYPESEDFNGVSLATWNPCTLDLIFHGIRQDGDTLSLVQDVDLEKGLLLFGTPSEGSPFGYWCGGYSNEGVSTLMCVAINNYHSLARYSWLLNDVKLVTESFPVVYTESVGKFKCVMMVEGKVEGEQEFTVVGNNANVPERVVINKKAEICEDRASFSNWEELRSLTPTELKSSFSDIKLGDVIGEGTFGVVHKAIWRGTVVAAKVIKLPGGSDSDLRKEIEMCRMVQHPNIVSIIGSITKSDKIYIISNLVRGCNLQELIFSNPIKPSFTNEVGIALQVAQGLAFLHSTDPPTVHLDIKPANILVESGTYHTYITDFGVAKVLTKSTIATSKTNSSSASVGTPGFQPKEQLKAERITASVDVYAFGVVMIELFGHKKVWDGLSALQIMMKVAIEEVMPEYSHLPDVIQPPCEMCLRNVKERASASDVLHYLLSI